MPTIIGNPLPHIPWQERPSGSSDVLWRFSQNPIINHDHIPSSNSIFNSAVVPYGDGFAGVFRCDSKTRQMQLHNGHSADGIHWPKGGNLPLQPESGPAQWSEDLRTPLGQWLDHWEMQRKIRKFQPQAAGSDAAFSRDWCKGHFDAHKQYALTAYQTRLEGRPRP